MGWLDKLRGEFIDIIEWVDDSNNTLVHRFERYQNEIKNGAKLIVREGQMAVFVNQGQLADVFNAGTYTLKTENLPILSTLLGWKHGFDSSFKAEVYFASTRNLTAQKWGTKNPITLSDDRFGMIELRAFGTYAIKVETAATFIREIVGTDGHFTVEEIGEQLRSMVVTRFTDAAGEAGLPIENYASNLNEISAFVREQMEPEFEKYGIALTKFLIENVSMPEEVKKEIFELSRLDKIDLDKLSKLKAAKAMEKAAENESGTAGAGMGMGMGMGMGFAMANQMGQSVGGQQASPSGPPPIPKQAAYYVVLDGAQAGPFDMDTFKKQVQSRSITPETLVWKEGMAEWQAAGKVHELSALFGSVPPPIPS